MNKAFLLIFIVSILLTSGYVNAQPDLVGYWKFDEGSGSTAIDNSVYGNDGTLYGGLDTGGWNTGCKLGNCLNFDGADDYIQVPDDDSISGFTQGFTASFWIKYDNVVRRQAILNKYNGPNGQKGWFIDGPSYTGNDLGFYASQDGINYVEWHANYAPTIGNWYYITVVWQSNTIPKFYINAQPLSTSGSPAISQIYNNVGVPLYIGKSQYDSSRNFDGTLDEVKIWDRSLTDEEIVNEYEKNNSAVTVNVNYGNIIGANSLSLGFQLDWDSFFGFLSNPTYIQLAKDVGFKLVRHFDFRVTTPRFMPCTSWNETAKNCNQWNWTNVDALTQKIFDSGAEPLYCLGYGRANIQNYIPPGMAVDPSTQLPYPESYAAYASAWVKHFKTTGKPVRYYEIMNEPFSYFGWDPINYTKLSYYMQLFNASATSMRQEDSNIKISFDFIGRKPVLDYWLANGGAEVDSINFHKYDSGIIGAETDAKIFQDAESQYFGTWPLGYSIKEAQDVYYNNRHKMLPIINSESNMNSAWENGTDTRIQMMSGAVWLALVLRMSMLSGVNYHTYFVFTSSKSWEIANKPSGGFGFGMINSNDKKPWYPYYVNKWIGNNLAIGDSLIESNSSSSFVKSVTWINNGRINILLINKINATRNVYLQGVTGQFNYSKINDPSGTSYINPVIQTGTVDASNPITMNGYTVMLLQNITTTPNQYSIIGQLKNKTNDLIQAEITLYQQGTENIIVSNSTDNNGNYLLPFFAGTYDLKYKLMNFFIPNFWVKLLSLNITSNTQDLVNYITEYPSENKVSFTVNVTKNQTIQTYSPNKPKRVLINGTEISEVNSLSELTSNTWFYDSSFQRLYIKLNEQSIPSPMLHASGTELFDSYGNKVFLKGVTVDKNEKMKLYKSTGDANPGDPTWFNVTDVQKIKQSGGNDLELIGIALKSIMPTRDVINEQFFVDWIDKWVLLCEQNQIYCIINIGGFEYRSYGKTFPDWLWQGIPGYPDYPTPIDTTTAGVFIRDFFDTDVSKQELNRQAFINAWKFIANRYKNNKYVLFSIMNEPMATTDMINRSNSQHLGITYSTLMERVIDGIRSTGAQQIIFIDKPYVWWLADVQPVNRNNIAWEDHLYVRSDFNISQWKSLLDTYVQRYTVDFGKPFFVGEYGVDPQLAVADWQNAMSQEVAYLNSKPIVGRQWNSWGCIEGEYYDFVYNYFTSAESDWIVQTVLG